jgi:hypothetical protein
VEPADGPREIALVPGRALVAVQGVSDASSLRRVDLRSPSVLHSIDALARSKGLLDVNRPLGGEELGSSAEQVEGSR